MDGDGSGLAAVSAMFLTPAELVELTGRKRAAHQVAMLRAQGIPCWVNAAGRPVVARAAIEGTQRRESVPAAGWIPKPLRAA